VAKIVELFTCWLITDLTFENRGWKGSIRLEVVLSRYTDGKTVKILIELLGRGQTRQVACRAAGIHDSTFNAWMRDAKSKPEFKREVERAEAISEEALVKIIQDHADKDWRSAKWLLARRFPHWREQAYTTQEVRNRLDELRIRKSELEVEYAQLRLEAAKNVGGDEDLLALLNTPIQLEDHRNGEEEDRKERKEPRRGGKVSAGYGKGNAS